MKSAILFLAVSLITAGANGALVIETSRTEGTLTVTLETGDYSITPVSDGQRIEINGFQCLAAPGRPMLPFKKILFALPPGAHARSVEIVNIESSPLKGVHRIAPAPPILPLAGHGQQREMKRMLKEWREEKSRYSNSDQAFPTTIVSLSGSGALRKYAYASIRFCPFTYHPRSGRVIHHEEVRFNIHYDLSTVNSKALMKDTLADKQAAKLFVNHPSMKGLYIQPEQVQNQQHQKTYDYVVITTLSLLGSITSTGFLDWKDSLGYKTRIVLISDPEVAGQPGKDLAARIRNFLRGHYGLWGIRYVLLVGNCHTVPMRYCYPDANVHTNNWPDPFNPGGAVPTDYYYADLSLPDELSWDSDGDGYPGEYGQDQPDFAAEVFVGRIPTSIPSRVNYTLNKLIAVEQDTGAWKNQALHAGAILFFENENHSGYPVCDGARLPYLIEKDLMPGWPLSHYSEQEGLAPSLYPWAGLTMTAFINEWRNGQYGVVNWSGHGSVLGAGRMVWAWDDGDGVPESSEIDVKIFVDNWCNLEDDHPAIVTAVSCSVGYPEPYAQGNLGVDLLTLPGFGAAAGVLSASRSAAAAVYWLTDGGGAESIVFEFNRYRNLESERLGDAVYHGKLYSYLNYGWEHRYEYLNQFGYNLYGDPSMVR